MSFVLSIIVSCIIGAVLLKILLRPSRKGKKRFDPNEDGWFGKTEKLKDGEGFPQDDIEIYPFTIKVDDEILTDLKRRLENTRLEEPMDGVKFQHGFNPRYMKDFVQYWKDKYDWRSQEKLLNECPQYTTQIEGIKIHFMRFKPVIGNDKVKVIPLLMLHGWPSHCFEFRKIIPLLTTVPQGEDFVFEVVCPSIPGFGFSEPPHRRGMNATVVARIFAKLMVRLGHSKFFVHGGDWGSRIASNMARFFPNRLYGLHFTMCSFGLRRIDGLKYIFFSLFPRFVNPEERFMLGVKNRIKFHLQEGGYFFINSTKPETLGCAMSDSPAGLAAYLLEKYSVATNRDYVKLPDGGLTKKYTMEELLNTVMITWVNNSFTAAARIYVENYKDIMNLISERYPIHVPTGIAVFPNEVVSYPRFALSQQMKNIVSYNIKPRGGHFPAMEEPEILADELWTFVRTVKSRET